MTDEPGEGNVLELPASMITKAEIPVEKVIDGAKAAGLSIVLILGTTEDGEHYAAASSGDRGALMDLIEEFKGNLYADKYQSR